MKKMNNKGFTLAELLIVVAIIAVLVAIAIPVFTTQLEKSREATDLANIRSGYAELMSAYLMGDTTASVTVDLKQTQKDWQSLSNPTIGAKIATKSGSTTGEVAIDGSPEKGGHATISVDDTTGKVTIKCEK